MFYFDNYLIKIREISEYCSLKNLTSVMGNTKAIVILQYDYIECL